MGDVGTEISLAELEVYLRSNPDVFLEHPELLELLELYSSPEGTVSLVQKQQQQLKEKNKQLNEQLRALIDNAHSNAELQHRVHTLCLTLIDAADLNSLLNNLTEQLQQEFAADGVAIRLFYDDPAVSLSDSHANVSQLHPDDIQLNSFQHIFNKQQPLCGRLTKAQKEWLFNDQADKIQSVACLPLGHEPCAGLLAIGSQDPNHFHANMATDYLSFLGEVFRRLLLHHTH